jgi:alpha-amylase
MQYFEWYLPPDGTLWKKVKEDSLHLANRGITDIWLPPAYKGAAGKWDVGYGVYDLYDLGEFDQKGGIATKYGTREEYLSAIRSLKENHIKVYADIVLNHKMGADETEEVIAIQEYEDNRNYEKSEPMLITAWTKYNFDARQNKYSSFKWNWTHFHGIDWDDKTKTTSIYKFYGKHWDENVDKENGNFDYLMGADIDLNNMDVVNELNKWGKWYLDTVNFDGVRLDAVKHIRSEFFPQWLEKLRKYKNGNLPAIGEYWSGSGDTLCYYLDQTDNCMQLFDVPLHYNFMRASISNGEFDMGKIFEGTLLEKRPDMAVTFVDNHDTEPDQGLQSWISDWFKPLAYSLILLINRGLPCVFYGDYYGIPEKEISSKKKLLDKLLYVRKYLAYGEEEDYFENRNVIGFVRRGDYEHQNSGVAVVMTDGRGGSIYMNMGPNFAHTTFYDILNNSEEEITTNEEGKAEFYCQDGSVSVWIKKDGAVN